MHDSNNFLSIVFTGIALVAACILFISIFFDVISFLFSIPKLLKNKNWEDSKIVREELFRQYEQILYSKSRYYGKLSSEKKKIFIVRVAQFIDKIKFVGQDIPEVTLEMKILISATAVQLTFGLDKSLTSIIKTIRIVPDVTYSKMNGGYMKGFFHPQGLIQISYKHFTQDNDKNNDGINLGLHEMAHAFDFSLMRRMEFSFLFNNLVKGWFENVKTEKQIEIPNEVDGFIREYGVTNVHEFYAACVENFFERPQEFAVKLPMIYKHLTYILNQNPLEDKPKEIPSAIHIEGNNALFFEPLSFKEFKIMGIVSTITLLFLYWKYPAFFVPILMIAIPYNIVKLIEVLSTKQVKFYKDYVIIKSALFGTSRIIHAKAIIYVAVYQTSTRTPKQLISFVYYENKIQEKHDFIFSTPNFISNIANYSKTHELIFIDKISKRQNI